MKKVKIENLNFNGDNVYTANEIPTDISELNGGNQLQNDIINLQNKIPDAPTTDGTYTLKCVVSSGVPSYQWVSENPPL